MPSRAYSLSPSGYEVPDDILIIAGSHGFPPTQARLARASEILDGLALWGATVDMVVLVESALSRAEEDQLLSLSVRARRFEALEHPRIGSPLRRLFSALERHSATLLGGRLHCPRGLLGLLKTRYAPRGYRAVIVCAVQLARSLQVFPACTEKWLDLPRIGSDAYQANHECGRELRILASPAHELSLLSLAQGVLVTSASDALRLRTRGFRGDLVLTPPGGSPNVAPRRGPLPPLLPHRILFVGSDTAANIEAFQWFRKHVYPEVLRVAPETRLRIVGHVAREVEWGPSVDRIGWVDDLTEEYANAARMKPRSL